MKGAQTLIRLRIFWRKSRNCRWSKQTSVSQTLPPKHWDIRRNKALVARRKGSFTPSTRERDVLKNVYDQTVTANCEEVFTEMSIKRAHLTANFAPGRALHIPLLKYTNSTAPGRTVDIGGLEKSVELQNIFCFVAGPSDRAV